MKIKIVVYAILILGFGQIGFSQKNYISDSGSKCFEFKGYLDNVPMFIDPDNEELYALTCQNGDNEFKFEFKFKNEFPNTSLMWLSNGMKIFRYKENNLIIDYKGSVDTIITDRQRVDYVDGQQFCQYKNTDTIIALLGTSDEVVDGSSSKPAFLNLFTRNKGIYEIKELPIRAINFTLIDDVVYYLTEEEQYVYKLYAVKVGNWEQPKLILDDALLNGWFVVEDNFIYTMTVYERKYYYVLVNLKSLEINKIRENPINEAPIDTPPIYLNKKYYIYRIGYTDFYSNCCKPFLLEYEIK